MKNFKVKEEISNRSLLFSYKYKTYALHQESYLKRQQDNIIQYLKLP